MIIVIADDFTGAAELGGIGLRYNFLVEMNTIVNLQSKADLLVIATDTRSMKRGEALLEMETVTKQIARLNPSLLFKKVDSVLRGYVTEELLVHIQTLNLTGALVVPANPALGRTIKNGHYFLNEEPLHLSCFSKDPEFPIKTSNVLELLNNKVLPVYSQKYTEPLKCEGIIVGDAADTDDLNEWADKINTNMLIAGASGFFTALLNKFIIPGKQTVHINPDECEEPALIVSGTAFGKSCEAIKKLKQTSFPVSYMPSCIIKSQTVDEEEYQKWCFEIVSYIVKFGKAIIAIDTMDTIGLVHQSKNLREKTALVTKMVFNQIPIRELFIEGGSTASAILKQLNISKIYPVQELALGVIRMKTNDRTGLYITLKPGSYAWPDSLNLY